MAKVDIQARASYIASKEGGIRAGARALNIPYSTFRRIVKGEVKTTKTVRAKLNRNFRKEAPKKIIENEKEKMMLVEEISVNSVEIEMKSQIVDELKERLAENKRIYKALKRDIKLMDAHAEALK